MHARPSTRAMEPLVYIAAFAAVALPGTMLLLSSEVQVAGWKHSDPDHCEVCVWRGYAIRPSLSLCESQNR